MEVLTCSGRELKVITVDLGIGGHTIRRLIGRGSDVGDVRSCRNLSMNTQTRNKSETVKVKDTEQSIAQKSWPKFTLQKWGCRIIRAARARMRIEVESASKRAPSAIQPQSRASPRLGAGDTKRRLAFGERPRRRPQIRIELRNSGESAAQTTARNSPTINAARLLNTIAPSTDRWRVAVVEILWQLSTTAGFDESVCAQTADFFRLE